MPSDVTILARNGAIGNDHTFGSITSQLMRRRPDMGQFSDHNFS